MYNVGGNRFDRYYDTAETPKTSPPPPCTTCPTRQPKVATIQETEPEAQPQPASGGAGGTGGRGKKPPCVSEYDVVPYKPSNSPLENHHAILDAWALANVPGYDRQRPRDSTTIALSKPNHDATKTVYQEWLRENYGQPVGAKVDWQSMGPREILELSERMNDAAGVPQEARDEYYSKLARYLYGLC